MVDFNNNTGNLVCVLLQPPPIFQETSVFDKTVQVLKGMVESHTQSIEGLKSTIDVSAETRIVNGNVQFVFNNIKRERSNVTMTFVEKSTSPLSNNDVGEIKLDTMQKLLHDWMIREFDEVESVLPKELVEHKRHMCCLFFETDRSHKEVTRAWLGEDMVPKTYTVERSNEETNGSLNLTVEWSGVYTINNTTRLFAQKLLDDF